MTQKFMYMMKLRILETTMMHNSIILMNKGRSELINLNLNPHHKVNYQLVLMLSI